MAGGTIGAILGGSAILGGVAQGVLGSRSAKTQASAADNAAAAQLQGTRESLALQRDIYNQSRDDLAPFRLQGQNALALLANETGLSDFRPTNLGVGPDEFHTYRGSQWDSEDAVIGEIERLRSAGQEGTERYQQLQRRRNLMRAGVDPDAEVGGFTETPGYAFRFNEGQRAVERSAAARGGLNSGATMKALTRYGQGVASQEYGNYLNRLAALGGMGQTATNAGANAGSAFASGAGNTIMSGAANQGNAMMAAGNARASGYSSIGNAFTSTINNGLGIAAMGGAFGGGGTAFPQTRFGGIY